MTSDPWKTDPRQFHFTGKFDSDPIKPFFMTKSEYMAKTMYAKSKSKHDKKKKKKKKIQFTI